jgi:dolichyl-phosphate-mannose--protein O-mannosyl transferase
LHLISIRRICGGALVGSQAEPQKLSGISRNLFLTLLLLIVGGTIIRSATATRLDGFTIDEAYHITAGVSYVRYADFRINPEHPPLVKLLVGGFISATGFHLSSIRPFADKADERDFAEQVMYLSNDFNSVQRRARIAMWMLNGVLLLAFAFAVRRAFGPGVALGTLLFLAIDPTVAAHLPVVMTDLPVSLLSATAVVVAIRAFQGWAWKDLVACSVVLGLGLATKHSAPVFLLFVVFAGVVLALMLPVVQSHAFQQVLRPGLGERFSRFRIRDGGLLMFSPDDSDQRQASTKENRHSKQETFGAECLGHNFLK